jgi:Flp pilus assembly protein TadG
MSGRRLIRRLRIARDGVASVEFALLAIPFLLMSFGIIEFGRLIWTDEALEATAAIGARCMGVLSSSCASGGTYSSSNTTTYILAVASDWNLTLTSSALTLTPNGSCGGVAGFSQVTISYTFETVVPQLLDALTSGIPMTVQACFPNQT